MLRLVPAACALSMVLLFSGACSAQVRRNGRLNSILPGNSEAELPFWKPTALVLDLSGGTRTPYLYRVPPRGLDQGFMALSATVDNPHGLYAGLYLNHSWNNPAAFDAAQPTVGAHLPNWLGFEGYAQYTRFFFQPDALQLKADLTDNVELNLAHDLDWVYASVTADAYNGATHDAGLATDVSRELDVALPGSFRHDTLRMEPTVEVGFGTQNFLGHLLTQGGWLGDELGLFAEKGPGRAGAFRLTGLVASVPVTWAHGPYTANLTPAVLLPRHAPPAIGSHPFFYLTFDVVRTIGWGRRGR